MKNKRVRVRAKGVGARKPLLSRRTKVRKISGRRMRKLRLGKGNRRVVLRKRRRRGRRPQRRIRVIHRPPVQVIPAPVAPPSVQVVPLPPDLGVAPETPPADAYQQGYTEAYNVGFDAGFAKGFEDGHKLEMP
ncbi:hypothetical protein [Paenibacillus sp. NFR01]|uniref:hypothetical protein n=1 Tax=Paenibacillus sp. NFR01 TaxID=1566279 RepID=UPI0008AE9F4C|nr:hypothetical protein [Paenibacillus sp. NFR01]SEU18735.1 hypothetical protein SAMN03159358_3823 [Paenibacillus sp. NFR01]